MYEMIEKLCECFATRNPEDDNSNFYGLMIQHWPFYCWKGFFRLEIQHIATDFTDCAVTGAGTTKLSTIVDNL